MEAAMGLLGVALLLLPVLADPPGPLGLSMVCWRATGVSHSLGRQRCRKGTHEDM